MTKTKIAFQTIGCKLNFTETSTISRSLNEEMYKVVSFQDDADIFVINTCTVTENADKKCRQAAKKIKQKNANAWVVIMGCLSQLQSEEIKEWPEVDLVLGTKEKFELPEYLKSISKEKQVHSTDFSNSDKYVSSYSLGDRTRTFLKIQDGCNYFCSYCAIPYARGRSRSDSIENILNTIDQISKNNIQEIILSGINIGDFGKNTNETLEDLINELIKIKTIKRFRLSSIEPDLLKDSIIDTILSSDNFAPHFHIPLQSGSDTILSAMGRKYKTLLFKEKIEYIKDKAPDTFIGTDLIVGFPGETDEYFNETMDFITSLPLSDIHVFSYSDRNGTKASKIQDKVPSKIITERRKKIQNIADQKKHDFYSSQLGKTKTVLFESYQKDGLMFGFTENYIKVEYAYNESLINKITSIKLEAVTKNGNIRCILV